MMHRFALVCCAVALVGCAKKEPKPAADSSAMVTPPAAAPAIDLAQVAGKWTVRVMPEATDSTILTYELNATADPAGWTLTFPGRQPIPLRVTPSGDSLIIDAGPYESALRKGVQVTTHSITRMAGGMLVSNVVAHYAVSSPDSVTHLRSEGTRNP
jgi:hypothetical protein